MTTRSLRLDREAVITGALGALAVAAWYLAIDSLAGMPGRTPSILGQVLLLGVDDPVVDRVLALPLAIYTVVHFVVFAVVGALRL